MKYRVTVGYTKFMFDDVEEAVKFSCTAKSSCEDDDVTVSITVLNETKEV